jgi:putative transposase
MSAHDTCKPVAQDWRIPNDLWDAIALILPKHKNTHKFGGGRPRTADRVCMEAILFVLRTGCQWKALDATRFCPGSTAHDRFQEWVREGVFAAMWECGLLAWDEFEGIDWSWLSMDGCMTKAPLGGEKTGKNPTDRAKLGAKRSLLTDGQGLPLGLAVDGANRNDMKLAAQTLASIPVERPEPTAKHPQGMCLDKGYDYQEIRDLLREFGFTAHVRTRGEELKKLARHAQEKARRWVVERTHSWMNRFRGILIRWNKKAENYVAMLHFSFAFIIYGQMGLSG